ncbi:MAG: aminoglycoside phosphotransferase family protein [Candidatus Heimdallarchaeota archaeon]|nr:MAG: aminoglycoside phosphotransferase family protein [Candidatus Heimdallarchaeota archaeon]
MNNQSKLLAKIPSILLPKKITSARKIEGGVNNRNILINESWLVKEYLIRDEPNDPVYLRFLREKDSLLLLKDNSHAPELLKYYDDDRNFYITRKWIEGQPLNNDYLKDNVEVLVNAVLSIHSVNKPTPGDFHYYDVIKRYLLEYKGMERHYPTSPSLNMELSNFPSHERLDQYFIDRVHQLQGLKIAKPLVRIHGDLVFSNIIVTPKNEMCFIDWEYSTLADPCIDLAYLVTQNQLPLNIQHSIADKFAEQLGMPVHPDGLRLNCDLMNLMSALWYLIQAARLRSTSTPTEDQQGSFKEFLSLAQDRFQTLDLL